mgnify:CR=1 FL=1
MGMRFRKSVKIAPGVRVNFGKKGVGVSMGTKGARVSVNTSGRRTTSVGIPGTGLSYVSSSGGSKKKSKPVAASGSWKDVGTVCYWLFVAWWWLPIRFLFYDLPRLCIRLIKRLVQRYKVWKAKQKYER